MAGARIAGTSARRSGGRTTRRRTLGVGLLAALALAAAACSHGDERAADRDDSGATRDDFTACQLADAGGVDDDGFNEAVFEGLRQAAVELKFAPEVVEPDSEADYADDVDALIDEGCSVIVTVRSTLGAVTAAAAEANPDQDFAVVDDGPEGGDAASAPENGSDNVRELRFAADEAAFLAGYLAAATTETGTVATYGGRNVAAVTTVMEGFEVGIDHYNRENGTDVRLVGWSTADRDGRFTGDFDDRAAGRAATEQLIGAGADIVMPVAGRAGLGTLDAIRSGGGRQRIIWVGTDGCVSFPDDCGLFLTSVVKNVDLAVRETVAAAADGEFAGGTWVGTLENDGVEIAPPTEFEQEVPQGVKDRLEDLRDQIAAGEIETRPDGGAG